MEPRTVRVAAVQFEPTLGDKAGNMDRLLGLVVEAADAGAQVIVTPEMATTGYCWYDREEISLLVEPIPGPTTNVFAEVARRYGCCIVVGMPEVNSTTGIYYNSAALVGPDGFIGVYRKTHSFISEPKWAKDGDLGLPVWDTPFGRLGILICADADFVEPARVLTLAGAEILCFPTNWLGEQAPPPCWITRAWENSCPLIAANRHGPERGVQFCGGSAVIGADGCVVTRVASGDGVAIADITVDPTRRDAQLGARRAELYVTQTLNTYLWKPERFHGLYGHRPLPEGRTSRIAVVQVQPRLTLGETLAAAGAHLASMLTKAEIVVLPDTAAYGSPVWLSKQTRSLDDATAELTSFARQHEVMAAIGILEQSGGRIFATTLLAGPDGLLTQSRRVHLVDEELDWLSPGSALPTYLDLPHGRLAVAHGSDLAVPEFARELALGGCDLVLSPTGGPQSLTYDLNVTPDLSDGVASTIEAPVHMHLPRQRASENHMWIAWSSLPHPYGGGYSGIFGPGRDFRIGESLVDAETEGVAFREVDTSHQANRAKDTLRRRQPRDYDLLQMHYSAGHN